MSYSIPDGIWPTMVTPFTENKEIDYPALEKMIEWYIDQGVHGLFAVCQSSEMFFLSLEERVALAKFVVEKAAGRVSVIASGHVSDSLEDQIEEIKQISAVGIDAFVLVSNRLAAADESEEVWRSNAEAILEAVPSIPFGVYECPHPYKRLLSPELLTWCAGTGRFIFLKDTCCDLDMLKDKIDAVRGTSLKIYNANSATLLGSLRLGAAGFSGVMANFHSDLYVKLFEEWKQDDEKAEDLQSFLGLCSLIERQFYPVNAKYHMQLEGLPIRLDSRTANAAALSNTNKIEVQQLHRMARIFRGIGD